MKDLVMSDDKSLKKTPFARHVPPSPERAQRAREQMEQATELLNQTLIAAEKKFAELGLGVAASVSLWVDQEDSSEDRLVFGKDGKEWKFSVSSGGLEDPPWDWTSSPLLSSSRELRARAADVLPQLYEALVKEAESRAAHLNNQASSAFEFLTSLETK